MSKKVLILSSSLRSHSNSDALAAAFAQGAREAGHDVEEISLRGKNVGFCRGCLACQRTGRCVQHDDADAIAQKLRGADVVVFATPIYYYEMSGQLKTLLDRMNPLYGTDYAFRDVYFLSTAADEDAETPDRAVAGLTGWVVCFEKARLAGTLFCGGVNDADEIQGNPALEKARDMGRSV